ncbi:MAG: 5-formyltetrahydrofolate cyclo-ligase [Acidimicrobiia bacterium]|nr:5-formyltetrahydrofolate cyclo-ligase [Acidimicrobiia bacterium]NNF64392.1 5-formyltetrahydrofolate cyclo-ligase [Acidimicrobiia bacterium]
MNPPTIEAGKAEWRTWAEGRRLQIDFPTVSRLVTAHLLEWRPLHDAGAVLIYLPLATEIDLTALIDVGVPCVATRTPERGGALTLHALGGALERHRYGFLQPAADAPPVEAVDVDLVLTPGLVFGRSGSRLGRGAGYYDELFTRLPNAYRVGVVPSPLVVSAVPVEKHDVSMHALATELGISVL